MNTSELQNFIREDIKIVLSEKVSAKIDRLLISLNTEVGFYGLVEKLVSKGITYFRITDILIYPQVVTGMNTATDDLQMANFFIENASRIKQIRYHGHSHVNMPTIPSLTDTAHMKEIVSSLKEDEFYIFQIFNRSNRISSIVYMDGMYSRVSCVREVDLDIEYANLKVTPGSSLFNKSRSYYMCSPILKQ